MSHFHESIKSILLDVERFLVQTIKDTKLTKAGEKQKRNILCQLGAIRDEYNQLQLGKPLGKPELYQGEDQSEGRGSSKKKPKDSTSSIGDGDSTTSGSDIPDVSATDAKDGQYAAYLIKVKDKKVKSVPMMASKKWAALKDDTLYLYDKPNSKKQSAAINIKDYEASAGSEPKSKVALLQLNCPGKKDYFFIAQTEAELTLWVEKINASSGFTPRPEVTLFGSTSQDAGAHDEDENLYELGDEPAPPPSSGPVLPVPRRPPPPSAGGDAEGDQEEYAEAFSPPPPPASRRPDTAAEGSEEGGELYAEPDDYQLKTQNNKVQESDSEDEIYDDGFTTPGQTSDAVKAKDGTGGGGGGGGVTRSGYGSVQSIKRRKDEDSSRRNHAVSGRYDNNSDQQKQRPSTFIVKNDFRNIYYGKWDYSAADDQELSFTQGSELYVLCLETPAWWVARLGAAVGFVPADFLTPAYAEVSAA